MEVTVKVIKYFGQVDGDNVFALYIRTKESEASINQFVGAVGIERMNDDMIRAGKNQLADARKLIEQGKKPVEVVAVTGVSLATATKFEKEFKAKTSGNEASNAVTSRMMSEEEIATYGPPKSLQIGKVPKDFTMEIGPVGISLAVDIVKEAIEPLKVLGVEDIYIVIAAGKGDKSNA